MHNYINIQCQQHCSSTLQLLYDNNFAGISNLNMIIVAEISNHAHFKQYICM